MKDTASTAAVPGGRPPARIWQKLLPWAITAACFAFLYGRIDAAAARQGQELGPYLGAVFARDHGDIRHIGIVGIGRISLRCVAGC